MQRSALSPVAVTLRVERLNRSDRSLLAALAGLALAWLAYTRLYFVLHPLGLTFDPSLFMWLTGKPDPLCGLTRTFAWTWRGDWTRAALVYPIGPVVFAGTVAFVGYATWALVSGRKLSVRLSSRWARTALGLGLCVLAANWIAKLLWLGM